MRGWGGVLGLLSAPVVLLAFAALVGLGVVRQADPAAIVLVAGVMLGGPAFFAASVTDRDRGTVLAGGLLLWGSFLLVTLPVYFPGERRDAVITGLTLLLGNGASDGLAASIGEALPDEPVMAIATPIATPLAAPEAPPAPQIDEAAIALPYEGEGRRLSVPVVFDHGGRSVETFMMLDTGATYTTLPPKVLQQLGAMPTGDAPVLTLSTANGQRQAQVVLLDRIWLGHLALGGVAVTTCDDCASQENAGLLGLNVAGGYNVTIDADRREVVLVPRRTFNRRLDVRPFTDLKGRFTRFPGGTVEVVLTLVNNAGRPITAAEGRVDCGDQPWILDLGEVATGATAEVRRRLPRHLPCETYEIGLESAWW